MRRVRARWAVPVHYGTFWPVGFGRVRPDLFHGPGEEFARGGGAGGARHPVRVLAPGETFDAGRWPGG